MTVLDDPTIDVRDITDLDQYKARVFAVARAEAHERGWCEVVDGILSNKLGLTDFYPNRLVVQQRVALGRDWQSYTTFAESDTPAEREGVILYAKTQWEESKKYNSQPDQPFRTERITVDADTDLDTWVANMKARQANIDKPKTVDMVFSRYRAVVAKYDGTVVEVLWTCEDEINEFLAAPAETAKEPALT